jgi:hypothetical protein
MPFEIIAAIILAIMGPVIFGHFTRHSQLSGKILKAVIYVAIAAVLTLTIGRSWSLIWTFGTYGLALVVHVGWCIAHGIHPVTSAPRDKYLAIRGWTHLEPKKN